MSMNHNLQDVLAMQVITYDSHHHAAVTLIWYLLQKTYIASYNQFTPMHFILGMTCAQMVLLQ